MNYDSTSVGVPYVRAPRIDIHYPPPGTGDLPFARIEQSEAVKLADGTSRQLRALETLDRWQCVELLECAAVAAGAHRFRRHRPLSRITVAQSYMVAGGDA